MIIKLILYMRLLNKHVYFLSGCSNESQKASFASQHDLPKSILKSSTGYMQNLPCAKSLELPGTKLVKSVLKREYEDSEQSAATLSNADVYPRSILKSNPSFKVGQTAKVVDVTTLKSEEGVHGAEKQNLSSEIVKFCEKLNSSNGMNVTQHNLQLCPCDDTCTTAFKIHDAKENEATVPSHKTAIFRSEEISSDHADRTKCKFDTISSNVTKKNSDKCRDNALAAKPSRVLDVDVSSNDNDDEYCNNEGDDKEKYADEGRKERTIVVEQDDNNDDNNDRVSSFADHQIHRTVTNEKRRDATQVIASIEMSDTPNVSIADRLAALRHNGSTNWKQRVDSGRAEQVSCDASLSMKGLKENTTTIKSGVLADCIGKLESAMEGWKSRVVTPDAINFTVAGKMKVTRSKDIDLPFLSETTANVSSRKKKTSRSQWLKTRKGKAFRI